jgi:hypothetical protein
MKIARMSMYKVRVRITRESSRQKARDDDGADEYVESARWNNAGKFSSRERSRDDDGTRLCVELRGKVE